MNPPFRLHMFNDKGEILYTREMQAASRYAYTEFADLAEMHARGLLSPTIAYIQMYRDDLLVETNEPTYPTVYR